MNRDEAIAAAKAGALQIQSGLVWVEANLADPRWAMVHGLLSKAVNLAEEILDAPGTIRPEDGGTNKPPQP